MMPDNRTNVDILIIGGGVIGVCSAYYLAKRSREVAIVDMGQIGAGCSYGNAGLIVPSHLIPLAAPGVIAQGLKWMLDAESPFYIKPRLNRDLLTWLWRFRAACKEKPMRRAMSVLCELGFASSSLYESLVAEERLDCHYKQIGSLSVYKSYHQFREAGEEAELLREFGVSAALLDSAEVKEMEPAISTDIAGGIFYASDAHLDPALFVQGLAGRVRDSGVTLHSDTEVFGFETTGRRISLVKTTRGDFRPQQVILANGSWSPELASCLRLKLPIQPAKGYSITFKQQGNAGLRIPLLLGPRVAVTPMGPHLRLAGTLELAGLNFSINRRRVRAILRAADSYLEIDTNTLSLVEIWRGLRPCTPDGLPIISRAAALDNLIIATGHATIGVSLGPITGKLVSELVSQESPSVAISALKLDRFS